MPVPRSRETTRGVFLFLYLLLVIAAYTAGKASRDAMFLARFHASQLPYADLAVTALVGVVVSLYIRIGRHLTMGTLHAATLSFFAACSVAFWALTHFSDHAWLLPAIYVWVGVFGVLAPAQVWTLADVVMTTRQAKRVFGIVGGGAIAGWILGGLLTTTMVKRFDTEYLLLVMAVALAMSAVVAVAIWRDREIGAGATDAAALHGETGVGLRRGLRVVAASPYLRTIALVIGLSSLATSVAAWQFKAVVQQSMTEKDALAHFFGMFNFYAGLAALAVAALTGRLLQRYGLGFALFVVPAALACGSAGLIVAGSLAAAVLLRASDQVLRYSIDKPTVELLYVPVSQVQTFQAKSVIDTVVWRAGEGLAAGVVLLFAKLLGWTPIQISWIVLALLALWMAAAYDVRRRYFVHLGERVAHSRHESELLSTAHSYHPDLNGDELATASEEDVLAALDTFAARLAGRSHPTLHALLRHSSSRVRQRALVMLIDARDESPRHEVEALLRDPELIVRTEALLYLTHVAPLNEQASSVDPLKLIDELGDFADFSVRSAMVAFLAGPGRHQNRDAARMILSRMVEETGEEGKRTRLEAARLLGHLPDLFELELNALLADPDPEVIAAAIRSAGALQKRALLPRLLAALESPAVAGAASDALTAFGPRIVGQLRDALLDPDLRLASRRQIPGVLQHIGTPEAESVLTESLFASDTTLRFNIIAALNKLRQQHPFRRFDTRLVETVLAAEIRGHYRSHQILSRLETARPSPDGLVSSLREAMAREVERIFRLLHLLYPTEDLHSAYFGVQSGDRAVHDNALELLENVLSPKLRDLLVPVLDSAVPESERLERARRILDVDVPTLAQAMRAVNELVRE
jgi:AAA family ATP:ADP antiporter